MPVRRAGSRRVTQAALLGVAFLCCCPTGVWARAAHCFTTDDGRYECQFRATGRDGSFSISAPRKPTFVITVIEPGAANGFVDFGGRAIPLPGRYLRSTTEPGCWVNDATATKICAW
jgi:hypothetical protein